MIGVFLISPPYWTASTGNPHLAIPSLAASLRSAGYSVESRDLNRELLIYLGVNVEANDCTTASGRGDIESLNKPYFRAEDKLNIIAKRFGGTWNAQLGFDYTDGTAASSSFVRESLDRPSPFSEFFSRTILSEIEKSSPRLVGISVTCQQQVIPAFQATRILRNAGYEGKIILGGNVISRLSDEFAAQDWVFDLVDMLMVFQGEEAFVKLIASLTSGESLSSIPNVIWRDQGQINRNPVEAKVDPDRVPTPDFEGLPLNSYWGVNCLPLLATRGCYFGKCTFCSIPFGYGGSGFSGIRSSHLVFADMEKLVNLHGIRRFKFMDEALHPKNALQLSRHIIDYELEVEWEGYARLDPAWKNVRFLKQLSRSGLRKLYFGLELIESDHRSVLNKHDRASDISCLLNSCNENGVKVHLFCMFGYPGTSVDDSIRTVEFVLENSHLIDTLDINPFSYAKHTKVSGVTPLRGKELDWALEYEYETLDDSGLNSGEVRVLCGELEKTIWEASPRLLHPTYRLTSPWIDIQRSGSNLLCSHNSSSTA